jgi:2-polyprenyl-6-methoxyphenol hydroxylase-like FAD-dependent oxidoreductase
MVPASDAAALRSPSMVSEMIEAFSNCVPQPILGEIITQLEMQKEVASFGETIACSKLHTSGGIVLLGDAAHTVTSSLGQGCNMALEGVGVLGKLLDDCLLHGGMPLAAVPKAYCCRRRADVHALQQLELMSMIMRRGGQGLRLKGNEGGHVAHARITLGSAMLLGLAQWKLMPQHFRTVPMYAMLYDPNVPYTHILAYVRRTAAYVCAAIGASAVFTMLGVMQTLQP